MADNRGSFRYRTSREAKVILIGGGTIACMVRDISTKGARLEFAAPVKLPEEFFLLIQGNRFRCRPVWQKENVVGVQYL
jgi:PilZ domain